MKVTESIPISKRGRSKAENPSTSVSSGVSSTRGTDSRSSNIARSSDSSVEVIDSSETKPSRKRKNVFDSPEISQRLKLGGSMSSSGSRTDIELDQDLTLQGSPSLRRATMIGRNYKVLFTGYQNEKDNHIVIDLGKN